MKQNKYTVQFGAGNDELAYCDTVEEAAIIACANRIKAGRNSIITSVTDEKGKVYKVRFSINY